MSENFCQYCGALWKVGQPFDHKLECIRHASNKARAFDDPLEEIAWITARWEEKAEALYLTKTTLASESTNLDILRTYTMELEKENQRHTEYIEELETAIREKNAACDALQNRIVEVERTCNDFLAVNQQHLRAVRVATIITTALAEKVGRLDGTLKEGA